MLDLNESLRLAHARLGPPVRRKRRSDAGLSRLPAVAVAEVRAAALGHNRPPMVELQRRVAAVCDAAGLKAPSRASLYNAFSTIDGHFYSVGSLPPEIAAVLYNLDPSGVVPGRQLALYCFNYGGLSAFSFAAALPWLDLYQASRVRGWRPRSRGLLQAVMRVRGI
jgi:hypothetical protein